MKKYPRMVRLMAGIALSLGCLLAMPFGVQAQTVVWDFEDGNEGFTLRSVNPATPAADDPLRAGNETLTGLGGPNGLTNAGLAWSIGTPSQWAGQIKALLNNGVYDPADTNLMGTSGYEDDNDRGQTNYLNTYSLNQHGDYLHSPSNDQIAKSPNVVLPANAVLVMWTFAGGSGSTAPALDGAGYTDGSGGVAVRSAVDDSLLASMRTFAAGTLTPFALNLSAFAGQNVYVEVVDAFAGSWGWIMVDEIRITQNTIDLPPDAIVVEAENFNFDNGMFINNPVISFSDPNSYYQKGSASGVEGVDFHETTPNDRFGVGGVEWRYDGFNVGFAGLPQTTNSADALRPAYQTAGVPDFDLSRNAAGEWWNYTRTVPSGSYHLYARVSSAVPVRIRVDAVDNATTASQNLTTRGWFIREGTGAAGLYDLVPLTDITGTNQVVLPFGGTAQTLRMTAETGGFDANFFVLDPTNLVANLIPVVSITSHTNNQVVNLGVETAIEAEASDDGSFTSVQFFAGGTLIGQDNTSPYSVTWLPTGQTEGSLEIRAVATDEFGLSSQTSVIVETIDPTAIRVTTLVGNGADNDLDEEDLLDGNPTGAIIQYRNGNGRNRIPVMRFDVSGYDLSKVANATLNVWLGRQHTRDITLRGILPGATNRNNSWTIDTYTEAEVSYDTMPGMGPSDYVGTNPEALDTVEWIEGQTILIGTNTIYGLASSPLESVDGAGNLTDYLRSQAGQTNIVLVWQHARTDNNLGRIMTKEADFVNAANPPITGNVGDFAPYLRFQLVTPSLEITLFSLSGDQLTLGWTGGTGPFTVQKKTVLTDAWTDHVTGISSNSATVTMTGSSGFYQVVGQ